MDLKSADKPLLISCGILQPEIETLIARKEIKAEAVFLNKYLHVDYRKLYDVLKASLGKYRARKGCTVSGSGYRRCRSLPFLLWACPPGVFQTLANAAWSGYAETRTTQGIAAKAH